MHNQSYYGGEYEVQETPGTTHVSALDKSGLAVSLTSTVRAKWRYKCVQVAHVANACTLAFILSLHPGEPGVGL